MGVVVTMDRRIAGVEEVRVQDAQGRTALVPQSLIVTLGEDQGPLLLSKVILSKGDGQKLAGRMGDRVRLRIEVIEPDTKAPTAAKDPAPTRPDAPAAAASDASAADGGAAGTDGPESAGGSGNATLLTSAKRSGRR